MHRLRTWFLAVFAAVSVVLAQGPDVEPVRVELSAFLVSEVVLEDGSTEERFAEATSAYPGQVIEYRLVAYHQGGTDLPPGTITLVGLVPLETAYLPGSATPGADAYRFEASLDGESFSEPPLLVLTTDESGAEVEVEADESDYRALRWVVLTTLKPGDEVLLVYRVTVL